VSKPHSGVVNGRPITEAAWIGQGFSLWRHATGHTVWARPSRITLPNQREAYTELGVRKGYRWEEVLTAWFERWYSRVEPASGADQTAAGST